MNHVKLKFTLTDTDAEALATLCRRAGLADFRACAKSEEEAYQMLHAATKLADALAAKGYV